MTTIQARQGQRGPHQESGDVGGQTTYSFTTLLEEYFNAAAASAKLTSGQLADLQKGTERFAKALDMVPVNQGGYGRLLELAATPVIQEFARQYLNYSEVWGTVLDPRLESAPFFRKFDVICQEPWFTTINVDLEETRYPLEDAYFEVVLCWEILQYMERDPMFLMSEINRITKPMGRLVLSTPNAASARCFWSLANGWRGHYYMQYRQDANLYRHNYEYDVHAITELMNASGFRIIRIETHDVFAPSVPEAAMFLKKHELPTNHRGDCLFVLAEKIGPVLNRYPQSLYD